MDISEDCWEHVGLLQEVSPSEPAPPPLQPDFLIQQQENILDALANILEFPARGLTSHTKLIIFIRNERDATTLGILSSFEEAAPPYPDTNLDVPKCPM
ncbi:homeobox protein caupolican-like isoform X1, partial [Vespula squamosa]